MALHWKIIIALILGTIYAFVASFFGWNDFTLNWLDPFGQIFIRLLKFIAVPLVMFSIISGISNLTSTSKLGRLGAKTLLAYLATTIFAVGIGILFVNSFKPGDYVSKDSRIKNRLKYELWVNQTEDVEIIDGKNFLEDPQYAHLLDSATAALEKEIKQSEEDKDLKEKLENAAETKKNRPLQFVVEMVPENLFAALSNGKLMLQVIFFAIFFGIILIKLPSEKTKPIKNLVDGINEVFLKMVEIIMNASPFFVFALMAGVIAKMADSPAEVLEIFKGLASYSIILVLGLFFMVFIIYPLIIVLFVKKISYTSFFKKISPAQFLAFSTSSSAATLPVTMECVRDNLGVSKNVSDFVLPIGATVNMDGTSLYQAVAVIFLAQIHLIDLTFAQQLTIVLTATLASIGSAAVPSAGLVMMILVLSSVGLNPAWIAIIIPVDRILDMCRTVVNVTGDATVSTLIAQSEGELNPT